MGCQLGLLVRHLSSQSTSQLHATLLSLHAHECAQGDTVASALSSSSPNPQTMMLEAQALAAAQQDSGLQPTRNSRLLALLCQRWQVL